MRAAAKFWLQLALIQPPPKSRVCLMSVELYPQFVPFVMRHYATTSSLSISYPGLLTAHRSTRRFNVTRCGCSTQHDPHSEGVSGHHASQQGSRRRSCLESRPTWKYFRTQGHPGAVKHQRYEDNWPGSLNPSIYIPGFDQLSVQPAPKKPIPSGFGDELFPAVKPQRSMLLATRRHGRGGRV